MFRFSKHIGTIIMATTLSCAYADGAFNTFTGKVIGKNVRLRALADVESPVVAELKKNELLVITGERGDFYEVQPPNDVKAYVFRTFILDDVVEGNRVHVRLAPELDAPVIGYLKSGSKIKGTICPKNTKWLEIPPPAETRFFIAKEFIEYAGASDLKATYDKRKEVLAGLVAAAEALVQSEIAKPFQAIDQARVTAAIKNIVDHYSDFEETTEKVQTLSREFTDQYLQKKIAYLESKVADSAKFFIQEETQGLEGVAQTDPSSTDRLKMWERIEEALYLSWAAMHHAKTMEDYYASQKLDGTTLAGILEVYADPIKGKPGDFVLKEKNVPLAYLYSTHVNLSQFIGQRVNLLVSERPNNNFAFPAYYVLDAQ